MLRAACARLAQGARTAPALRRFIADNAAPTGFVSASELKKLLAAPASSRAVTVVDVREDVELAAAVLPGVVHLPLSQAAQWRVSPMRPHTPAVVICQHGRARSNAAAAKLRELGLVDVKILSGGLEAYSKYDPSVPTYPKYTPTFKF